MSDILILYQGKFKRTVTERVTSVGWFSITLSKMVFYLSSTSVESLRVQECVTLT